MELNSATLTDSPQRLGITLGVLFALFARFVQPVELHTGAFLLVGIVLAQFGEGSWGDIGQAFLFIGVANAVVWVVLRVVFGGPLF